MSEIQTSRLRLHTDKKGNQRLYITYRTKKGNQLEWSAPPTSYSAELSGRSNAERDGLEVDFELIGGHPDRIRTKGAVWQAPAAPASTRSPEATRRTGGPQQRGRSGTSRDSGRTGRRADVPRTRDFHNPYNFIPAPRRNRSLDRTNPLGDGPGAGHHAYLPGRWSGRLSVSLTTITPLLLPDASRVVTDKKSGHKHFPVRRGSDGAPYIPPASIKGLLRSAFEAITNSRFGVFEAHDRPLGLRMEARESLKLVPAAVTRHGDELDIRLMPGDATIGDDGRPKEALMYAAWLPRYKKSADTRHGGDKDKGENDPRYSLRYPGGALPAHGDRVWVRLEERRHRSGRFSFLQVREIERARDDRNPQPGWRRGIVCITGRNIMNKHDERVFLEGQHDPRIPPLDARSATAEQWKELITDYQEVHKKELKDRDRRNQNPDDYLGREPGNTGWSRHIFDDSHTRLDQGQPILCYAKVSRTRAGFLVHRLYPVMISRDLFDAAPDALLDESLHPAKSIGELSPADRVFGWVLPAGAKPQPRELHAWKGQLRVGTVSWCDTGTTPNDNSNIHPAIERIAAPAAGAPPGVPLAILGQPKPQQSRFYVARDQNGNPLPDGSRKDDGYHSGQALRGRKVYPHHRQLSDLEDYWQAPSEDRTQDAGKHNGKAYFQEYRRPEATNQRGEDSTRDDQNRTMLEWVKPDIAFRFDIQVTNLSQVELGALLWLLTLQEGMHLRLGGGKPLGFGSVHLTLNGVDLRDGECWRSHYRHLLPAPRDTPDGRIASPGDGAVGTCILAFQQALIDAHPAPSFDAIPFIKAFVTACRGFEDQLPIHYPRVDPAPNPEGKNFLWFTENDGRFGLHLALPALHLGDRGLPLRPKGD